MKKCLAAIVLAAVVTCVLCSPSFASTISNIPSDHRIHGYIEELGRRGLFRSFFFSDRPYTRENVVEAISEVEEATESGRITLSPYEAWLIERLKQEFQFFIEEPYSSEVNNVEAGAELEIAGTYRHVEIDRPSQMIAHEDSGEGGEDGSEGQGRAILFGWAEYGIPHVSLSSRFRVDTRIEDDNGFLGRPWRGETGGYVVSGYGKFDLGPFEVLLGRDKLYWGPGKSGSLILSDFAPPLDMVCFGLDLGRVSASGFFTTLDDRELTRSIPYEYDSLYVGTVATRHLSGHRIDVRITPSLEVGLSETVVYGGPDRELEPGYINPLNFFYAHQWNLAKNDNPIWALDATWWPVERLQVYGQLLVDDYQFERKTERDEEPSEIGFLLGLYSGDPLGLLNTSVTLEYARVNSWTYNQPYEWNRYTYGKALLGHPIGPDSDALYLSVRRWFGDRFTGQLDYRFLRHGEISVDTDWPVPLAGPWDGASFPEGFPIGTAAKSHRLGILARFHPMLRLDVDGFVTVEKVSDYENTEGLEMFSYEVGLRVSFKPEVRLPLSQ
ncbi:MAG: hypothetical protein AMJ46_08440 [Latescibacteria bacterium DG_63]|nr:MAG: hypothetical protein AMJ46_08440 [Latescibacteria bacterium DG_63]